MGWKICTVQQVRVRSEKTRVNCARAQKRKRLWPALRPELTIEKVVGQHNLSATRVVKGWIRTYGSTEAPASLYKMSSRGNRMNVALQIRAGLLSVEEAARQNSVQIGTILNWIKELDSAPQSAMSAPANESGRSKPSSR